MNTIQTLGTYAEPAFVALLEACASALRQITADGSSPSRVPNMRKLINALKRASPYMLEDCWCNEPDRGGKAPHEKLCKKVRAAIAMARST